MSPLLPIHITCLLEIIAPKDAFTDPTGSQCFNTCQTSTQIKASELAQPHVLPCFSCELGWQQECYCPPWSERESGTAAICYSGSLLRQAIRSGPVLRELLPWRCVHFDSGNDPIVNEKLGMLLMERHFLEIERKE